ncbi:MAG: hypothetical protein QXQ94_09010 [Candidatus Bathyarchaeia archaeon]
MGFIKVIVFLTYPSSFTYTQQLVSKYKTIVKTYRDKEKWNIDPETGEKVAGKGIGREDLPASEDFIAINHVSLAQNLHFIRRDINTWDTYGQILSALYTTPEGRAISLDVQMRETLFKTKGLIARLSLGERLIFCDSLLYSDIDGIVPLLCCFDNSTKTRSELVGEYFEKVVQWFERKAKIETISSLKSLYLAESARFKRKSVDGQASILHKEMQVEPRLNFLLDVGVLKKNDSGYSLSDIGRKLQVAFLDSDDKHLRLLLDEKERKWSILLSKSFNSGLAEISEEEFDKIFFRVLNFFRSIGLILIPYESVFLACAAFALNSYSCLDFETYEEFVKRLAKSKGLKYSLTVPGRRYIHA